MGTTLTGTKVKDTYKSLVKLTDNAEASATGKQLSDGNGNDLGVFVDTDGVVGIGAAAGVSLDVSSKTDAIRIPNGTTAQRVTGTAGQIRYNTTTNKIEGYVAGSTNDFVDLGQSAGGGGDLTAIVAGNGLTGTDLSGPIPTLNANVDDATIEINSDALRVKDAGITASKLAADAIGSASIADNAVVTAAINANAVTAAKLSLLDDATAATDTHILVADGTDFINKAVSGDATLANTGAITIANDAVTFAKIENRYTELVALGSNTSFALNFLNGTTFTATASGAATFTFSNAVQGQTIDLIVTGNYALTFAESGGTFNKIGSTNYDGTTTNIIQITCTDDTGGATIYHYTVATYASGQPQ